ncbi:TolC family outer membrane protein [Vogesella sp. DC21W]|uniref:TolC family outer membrane protein n=1 Tax=Vogesella aquatica TaxID=2984206 RepID=A0ABT5J383_9NEIS|nr:TolC family outer membrane protein [Vogesella aquatica]MDC7718985.1 TolC family outer membrane protein [Vogesella aquatica]
MNFRPKRIFGSTLIALLALSLPMASHALELKDTIEQTLKNNAEVRMKWHTFRASLEERGIAEAGFKPTVDLSYATAREKNKVPTTTGGTSTSSFTRHGYNLALSQNIFAGFITTNQVKQLDYTSRARYFEYLAAAEQQGLESVRAFVDVVRYSKLVNIAEENYAIHKGIYEQILQRVTQGVGRRVDLEQIAGRLALAESNLVNELSNLNDVSARYARITGEVPANELQLPALNLGLIPAANDLMVLADKSNPSLQAARAFYRAAEAEIDVRRGAFSPTLDLRANKAATTNKDGVKGRTNEQAVELAVNLNLYRGGADRARLASATERRDEAEALGVKACRDMRQQVSIAYNDSVRISSQLESLRQHQLSTEKARDAYRKQFDIGQRTLLDMLDSENELFESRRELLNAELNQQLATYRVLGESGRLMEVMQLKPKDDGGNNDSDLTAPSCPTSYVAPIPLDASKIPARSFNSGAELAPIVANTTPVSPSRDITVNLQVQFDLNSAKIRAESLPMLDQLASTLQMPQLAQKRFLVEGHTDSTGNAASNLALSQQRAQSVQAYLVSRGIPASRMDSVGRGSTQPLPNKAANDPQNRRVAVVMQETAARQATAPVPVPANAARTAPAAAGKSGAAPLIRRAAPATSTTK